MKYRHELKFLVNEAQLAFIESRIKYLVKLDKNQPSEDGYIITSLYFDDINDKCYKETVNGYDYRNKYRMRIYGHNSSLIKLERKSKIHGMTAKKSVIVSERECRLLMAGVIPNLSVNDSELKKDILCNMKLTGMRPKCIVQYNRCAFIYKHGNVRITFDKNICGSVNVAEFLNRKVHTTPLLEQGIHILEVKYDNLFPGFISEALEIDTLQQTSFSKYGYTRKIIG